MVNILFKSSLANVDLPVFFGPQISILSYTLGPLFDDAEQTLSIA